jgi:hypothetical protein
MTLNLGLPEPGFTEAWSVSGAPPAPAAPVPAIARPPAPVARSHGSAPVPGAVLAVPEGPVPAPGPGTGQVPAAGTGTGGAPASGDSADGVKAPGLAARIGSRAAAIKAEVRRRAKRRYGLLRIILTPPETVADYFRRAVRAKGWDAFYYFTLGAFLLFAGVILGTLSRILRGCERITRFAASSRPAGLVLATVAVIIITLALSGR